MLIRACKLTMNGQCLDTVGILHHIRSGSNIAIADMLKDSPFLMCIRAYALCAAAKIGSEYTNEVTFAPTSPVRRRAELWSLLILSDDGATKVLTTDNYYWQHSYSRTVCATLSRSLALQVVRQTSQVIVRVTQTMMQTEA